MIHIYSKGLVIWHLFNLGLKICLNINAKEERNDMIIIFCDVDSSKISMGKDLSFLQTHKGQNTKHQMDFLWQVDCVLPWGGAGFSADPWMSDTARLWQPSLVLGEGSAACPCLRHTELPPGRYAVWAEPRCRPGTRMWTPLRPPAG